MPERLAASHRVVDLPAASSPPRHIGRFQLLLRRALAELEAIRHIVLTRLLRQLELRKKRLRALPCRMEQRSRAILPEAVVQLGVVPVANYATPGTQEVPDSIAPYCRSHNGVLLANHGALTWGKDPEQAYMRMESLEYYATVSRYTGHIIGEANERTCERVDRLVDTRTRLGIQSGGRPVCRHAEAGEPRPCECGLCNLTPAALSELICHLIATLPEDVIRLLRHSS